MSDIVKEYAKEYAREVAIKTFMETAVMFQQDRDTIIKEACRKYELEQEEAEKRYDEYACATV